ncbi:MAG: polysaccharide biosynthesis tyrosine autokinase [Planctomycetota bacterium]|jgi:capsular exopolysaccharide synthesis family protein
MVENKQVVPKRPVVRPSNASSLGLTPKEIIAILRRHLFLIICFTITGFIVAGVSWFLLRRYAPKYTATSLVEVLPSVDRDPMDLRGILVSKDIQYSYRLDIASLMNQQGILMELLRRDKVKETNWYMQFGNITAVRLQNAYRDLERNLRVNASREANFVLVSMTCGSGSEAALIVNQLIDLFVNTYGDTKKREANEKLAVFTSRRDKIQQELEVQSTLLEQVRGSLPRGYADFETGNQYRDTTTLRFDNLQIQQDSLALEISQLQGIISSLQRQATGPINEQVKNLIETDPIMVSLAQQKELHITILAGQLSRLGEGHREVQQTQERIIEVEVRRDVRKKVIAEQVRRSNLANAQDQLVALLQRWDELDKRRAEALKQKEDFDRARVLYDQRLKARDERQQLLNSIKAQIEKQRMIAEDPETAKVRSVGPALEPRRISSPRWELYFPGGIFLGFLLGLGLTFAIELLNDLVRTPRDVSRYLHIPLLGVIPDADEDRQVRDIDLCHVVIKSPYSVLSESYIRLRTNFELSGNQKSTRVMLLSSGMPGEGNTTVAANLAPVLAGGEKKVLLIDANFRRPSIESVFLNEDGEENMQQVHMGLGDLLKDQSNSQEVIMNSPVNNIDIICAGTIPLHPSELLGGSRMKELIEEQRNNYDYIIIDGPPILLVSDTKMLASLVDGVMLVFNAGSTHRGTAQRTILELRAVNANIIGCVLCAVKSLKGGYFREQFKTYRQYQKVQLSGSA